MRLNPNKPGQPTAVRSNVTAERDAPMVKHFPTERALLPHEKAPTLQDTDAAVVPWDGETWHVAWSRAQRKLWVFHDDAGKIGRCAVSLLRLAIVIDQKGTLPEVLQTLKMNPGVVIGPDDYWKAEREQRESGALLWKPGATDLPAGVADKATALRGVTALVAAAYALGATPDDVRFAVYSGMGLEVENAAE